MMLGSRGLAIRSGFEGAVSFVFGILCWVSLPKACDEAWFLKPNERQLMKDRRIRDVAYTGKIEYLEYI